MIDANTYYLNQHLKEEENYAAWIENNKDTILEQWIDSLYPLTFDNVPDEFIREIYNNMETE